MSISPFPARPGSPETEARRARIVVALVVLGIAASLLAYAISPSVRHAVKRAAHSVAHSVSHVFDKDDKPAKRKPRVTSTHGAAPKGAAAHSGPGAASNGSGGSAAPAVVSATAPEAAVRIALAP